MTDQRSIDEVRRSIERLRVAAARTDEAAPQTQPEAPAARPPARREAKAGPKGRQALKPAAGAPAAPRKALTEPADPEPAGKAPAGVRMDPRIRRRRIDVRRDEGRKRLRILVGCLSVVALVAGAAGAGRSPLFDVDYADVRGAERTPRRDVVRAGALAGHPAMLDIDTATIARRVEALPWVLEATVRRQWPGTVRIDVTERSPAAVLPAAGNGWALADRTGRVLQIGPDKPAGLPVIGNTPRPERAGASVPEAATPSLRVAAALPATVRPRVADVATLASGEVELQLTPPGGVVRLGAPVDLDHKLSVVATVLARVDLAGVSVIDVRVPRAPALTRR